MIFGDFSCKNLDFEPSFKSTKNDVFSSELVSGQNVDFWTVRIKRIGLDMSEKKSNFCKRQFFATDEIALHAISFPEATSQVCIENHEKFSNI